MTQVVGGMDMVCSTCALVRRAKDWSHRETQPVEAAQQDVHALYVLLIRAAPLSSIEPRVDSKVIAACGQ